MRILAKDTHPRLLRLSGFWRDVFRDLASNLSDCQRHGKLVQRAFGASYDCYAARQDCDGQIAKPVRHKDTAQPSSLAERASE